MPRKGQFRDDSEMRGRRIVRAIDNLIRDADAGTSVAGFNVAAMGLNDSNNYSDLAPRLLGVDERNTSTALETYRC